MDDDEIVAPKKGVYDEITPTTVVNKYVGYIIGFVVFSSLFGLVADRFICRKRMKGAPQDRPRGWVLGMLLSSYMLLLPGLFHTLFGYKIAVMNGMKVMSERKENTVEFAQELWESGSALGCFFVVTFAMVLPVVKLVLLALGGILRHSKDIAQRKCARRSVIFVQRISKWASPDMFAYILMTYLIRGINHPPILCGNMDLDIGFSCFATFCIASTICSLGARAPSKRDLGLDETPKTGCGFQTMTVLLCVIAASIVFIPTLYYGVMKPCMALRVDMNLVFESGEVDISLKPVIEMLHVQELAADDVSLWECATQLYKWIMPSDEREYWEMNSLVAFLLLSVLVMLFTVLDMIVLLAAAIYMHTQRRKPVVLMELAHFLRKLSMLDVCTTGILIIILAGRIYRASGVVVTFQDGWVLMVVAEVCHYIAYYAVSITSRYCPEELRRAGSDASHQAMMLKAGQGSEYDESDIDSTVGGEAHEDSD